jgi:large subunit ribosomal protein L4
MSMALAKILTTDGTECGTLELSDAVFNVAPNVPLVHQVIVALQAAKRQGTHKVKVRSEVSGGGKKPWRQKGTGRARHGSIREPQWRGGGTVHGPVPRSYRKDIPVRMKRQALCCVLSDRLRNGQLVLLEGLQVIQPKTKPVALVVSKVAPQSRRTLVVTPEVDKNLLLSTRNIPNVNVCTAADLNALDVIQSSRVVILKEAVKRLEERLA